MERVPDRGAAGDRGDGSLAEDLFRHAGDLVRCRIEHLSALDRSRECVQPLSESHPRCPCRFSFCRNGSMPRLRRTLCEQLADSISSAVSADNAVSAGSRHDKVDSPVAEAKPSTVARPAQSLALVFASGIIESTSMTRSAPAAKPSMPARRPGALTCSGIPSSNAPIASGKPSDPPPERPPIRVTAWSAREDHRTYAEANGNSDQPTDLDAFLGEFKGTLESGHRHRTPTPRRCCRASSSWQVRERHR